MDDLRLRPVGVIRTAHRSPEGMPFRDTVARGVVATRSPARPNPIGLSCVRLLGVDPAGFSFAGADMLDGTPLLDLKPYVWTWDAFPGVRSGWYETAARPASRSDDRFAIPGPAA